MIKRKSQKGVLKTSEKLDLNRLMLHVDNLDLSNSNNLNFWLYIRIAILSGLRSVDILEMTTASIDSKTGITQLIEKKTKKGVKFTIPNQILSRIDFTQEFVIWNSKYKSNVSLMTINRRLKSIFPCVVGISSHSVRKSIASYIYSNNENDIIKAMTFLNHSSPVMTKNYLGINEEEKEMMYRQLDVFLPR
jgi:integrase